MTEIQQKAEQYAKTYFHHLGDTEDEPLIAAYLVGASDERERLQAQIKLAWEDGWLSRTKACGLSAGEIMAKKFQRWNIFKQTKDI